MIMQAALKGDVCILLGNAISNIPEGTPKSGQRKIWSAQLSTIIVAVYWT